MHPTEALRVACRRRGLPLTAQRKTVYESLCRRGDHPTADDLFLAVRGRVPGISRATVYRILTALVDWGLAGKVSSDRRGARFDGNLHPHHHFQCSRCDRVLDCAAETVRVSPPPSRLRGGFRIQGYSVVFRGLCPDCSRKER